MKRQAPVARPRFAILHSAWLDAAAFLIAGGVAFSFGLRTLSGGEGLTTIHDDEVAVVYDNWSGASRQVDTPGNLLSVPFLQDVKLLKRSPVQMSLAGESRVSSLQVPELSIRASDGSSFRFESFTLQFALLPDLAGSCLEDTNAELEAAALLVEAYARSILRDEYGRFSTREVVLHESLKAANAASRARLDKALRAHGLQVVELSTPKPRFDPQHELAVERRKVANQEVERLKTKFQQLDAEHAEALARLEKDKELELAQLELGVADYRAGAQKESLIQRTAAERYLADRQSLGETARFEKEQQALSLTERHTVAATALQARVDELAQRGEYAVRAAWIRRLSEIPFRVLPYSLDARPVGVELTETTLLSLAGQGR